MVFTTMNGITSEMNAMRVIINNVRERSRANELDHQAMLRRNSQIDAFFDERARVRESARAPTPEANNQ